jgi:hypothetical protein
MPALATACLDAQARKRARHEGEHHGCLDLKAQGGGCAWSPVEPGHDDTRAQLNKRAASEDEQVP